MNKPSLKTIYDYTKMLKNHEHADGYGLLKQEPKDESPQFVKFTTSLKEARNWEKNGPQTPELT